MFSSSTTDMYKVQAAFHSLLEDKKRRVEYKNAKNRTFKEFYQPAETANGNQFENGRRNQNYVSPTFRSQIQCLSPKETRPVKINSKAISQALEQVTISFNSSSTERNCKS